MSNSILEELRAELDYIQAQYDIGKQTVSRLDEEHKELDPDPDFDVTFALMRAEADHYITEVEKKIELLKNEIKRLEFQN